MLLIRAISLTRSMLMIVVMTIRLPPRISAFWAPPLVLVSPASADLPGNLKMSADLGQHDLPVDGYGGDRHDRTDDVDPAGHARSERARTLRPPL